MTALMIRRLTCNGADCPETVDSLPDVELLYSLRQYARNELGWTIVGSADNRQDYCPAHRPAHAPVALEAMSRGR